MLGPAGVTAFDWPSLQLLQVGSLITCLNCKCVRERAQVNSPLADSATLADSAVSSGQQEGFSDLAHQNEHSAVQSTRRPTKLSRLRLCLLAAGTPEERLALTSPGQSNKACGADLAVPQRW